MEKVTHLLNEIHWFKEDKSSSKGNTTLHQAPNVAVVKELLAKVEDHNALDCNGDTPVHCYVKRTDKEKYDCLITLLIYGKYDINIRNKDGQTALHLACKDNDVDVAKALIVFDAKINSTNSDDHTPLDLAPPGSEIEELLALLGAMRYQELLCLRKAVGDHRLVDLDTLRDDTDDDHSTPSESVADSELNSIKSGEEKKSPAKADLPVDKEKEVTLVDEDTSLIGTSLMLAEGLATSGQQQQHGENSEASSSPGQQIRNMKRTKYDYKRSRNISTRRCNILRRRNTQKSFKSRSRSNPDMEVMDSIIGQSVAGPRSVQPQELRQRILCLDGGGMKGLIQIEMLKIIEQMTGKSITELFDWMVGTSTGAILALGMIYGERSLESLRSTYFAMKDSVFKSQYKLVSQISDTCALEETIKDMYGTERRMGDVKKPKVLVTAVDKSTTDLPLVFFNNCFEDEKFNNELVWKVGRYTTAAPVYFSECDNYVDGGVKANNPTAFGITEIQSYLSRCGSSSSQKISCVVSLGCGEFPAAPLGNTNIADGLGPPKPNILASRVKELLSLLTSTVGSSTEVSKHSHAICEQQGIAYFRLNPKLNEATSLAEKDSRKLCDIIIKAKQLFRENAEQVERMIENLGCKIQEDYVYHI